MSYETSFSVEYKFEQKNTIDRKKFNNSIIKGIRANYEKIARNDATRQETQNDWFDFLVNDDGKYISTAYAKLNVLVDIAHQFIRDELTDYVTVIFEWDGEESGDYTENIYHVRKVMELGKALIETTKEKAITKIIEVSVDINERLDRE